MISANLFAQPLAETLACRCTIISEHLSVEYCADLSSMWALKAHLNNREIISFKGFSYITTRGIEFSESINKNHHGRNRTHYLFTLSSNIGYIDFAPAKSGVRICTLNNNNTATYDALSVFFCVTASQHLPFRSVLTYTYSMVMLAGQPSGWLVSVCASSANPASVTASIEICTSRGDSVNIHTEIATMATTLTPTHFKFVFLNAKRSEATFRAGLYPSLYKVILAKSSQHYSEELHDFFSLVCGINHEVHHSLHAAINGEDE
ncbi:ash family protein [Xenorhabdus sp. Vera]|uniref:ash family protein n=1 Tax=Xenorhabdus koppenhoeferi TaxID=351659 RepID=UPI0019956774|nr:ash family protein [Xenorhabdus sp. Vera]MBD2809927.1 ash family protein [Xenorhabdus sp. Vera]